MSSGAEHVAASGPLAAVDARALTRLLRRSLGRGFRLVVIEVATPRQRQKIVEWLRGELEPLSGELIDLDVRELPGENLWSELDERLDHGTVDRQRVVLALHGFQEAVHGQPDEKAGLYRQLNVQRDLFVRDLGCFWVVLIDPYGSRKLQDIAPDFCDFASLWVRAPEDRLVQGDARAPMVYPAVGSLVMDGESSRSELLQRADEAIKAGRLVEAQDLLTRFELGADADDEQHGRALLLRGRLALVRGDLDAAHRAAEQVLAWGRTREHRATSATVSALTLLGIVLNDRGEYEQARIAFEQALELVEQLYGADHPNIAPWLLSLARVHLTLTNTDEARRLIERARTIEGQPTAASLQQLAWLSYAEGNYDEACRLLEQALELELESLGTQLHPDVATLLAGLASVHRDRGDLDAARHNVERALQIQAALLGTEPNPDVAASLRQLGVILREQGELERARQTLERSLAVDEHLLGTQAHPKVMTALHELAQVHRAQGDLDGARQRFTRATELAIQLFGTEFHPLVAAQLHWLALTLAEGGELDEAVATYQRALNIEAHIYGPDHPSTCKAELALAQLLLEQGDQTRAAALLHHARPILADAHGPSHELVQLADRLLNACSRTPPA